MFIVKFPCANLHHENLRQQCYFPWPVFLCSACRSLTCSTSGRAWTGPWLRTGRIASLTPPQSCWLITRPIPVHPWLATQSPSLTSHQMIWSSESVPTPPPPSFLFFFFKLKSAILHVLKQSYIILVQNTLLKWDVTRRDHVSVVMDAGSRIVNFIVNFIHDGTVFA